MRSERNPACGAQEQFILRVAAQARCQATTWHALAASHSIRLVPAARSEERCPRLEIQSWRSGKAGGPEYRCLRGRRRLGMTSAADIAAPGGTIQRAHELLVLIAIDHQLDECGRTSRRGAGVLCLQVVVQV